MFLQTVTGYIFCQEFALRDPLQGQLFSDLCIRILVVRELIVIILNKLKFVSRD